MFVSSAHELGGCGHILYLTGHKDLPLKNTTSALLWTEAGAGMIDLSQLEGPS